MYTIKNQGYLYSFLPVIFIIVTLITGYGCRQTTGASLKSTNETGSGLLPIPQKLSFSGRDFRINDNWIIKTGSDLSADNPSVQNLISGLKELTGLEIRSEREDRTDHGKQIRLTIRSGSVPIPFQNDSIRTALADQAYFLKLNGSEIEITANASAGLFYGIQTLFQLLKTKNGKIYLPEGEVTDWPDMELRIIYWDCAHHLDKLETFKRAIKQAAYFKINGFALKLEGHFQYKGAAHIVEPYALTPSEYQELTNYAKAHFVELIPYLDAPAHVSFILKHPEYSSLRAFPNSNYEFSITNPGTDRILSGMFGELMDASQGGKYILLSTDEAYYAGKSESEKKASKALGGNGKLLADFIKRISDKLHDKGRTVIFWGEYPLTASDISSLPSHLINGVYNKDWAPLFKQNGIRQLIYTSTQGVEPLFPNYFPLSDSSNGRVDGLLKTIYGIEARGNPWITGAIVAAWGDSGLHPETFWLGYATGCSAAWNTTPATSRDLTDRFFIAFYGEGTTEMNRIYQLLSEQADHWNKSWDWKPSDLRTPISGNSRGIYEIPRPAMDQTLPGLPVPSLPDLSLDKDWSADNLNRLRSAEISLKENDELLNLLQLNIRNVGHRQYNLEVMNSVALLCRQNLNMLLDLKNIDSLLKQSSGYALSDPSRALSLLDQALDRVKLIREQRNETLRSVTTIWYQDWYPRVSEANGRKYLDMVDDIKDHLPVRTVDMSYLIYREINYPLGKWAEELRKVRNQFAKENSLFQRTEIIGWMALTPVSDLLNDLTPRLMVSENHRYLMTEKGDPFFWLGDTGWMLFSKLSREEAERYFDDRKEKGFNVIQVMVLQDVMKEVNFYGDSALTNHRIDQPLLTDGNSPDDPLQYDYWDHVSYLIKLAAKKGLYMAMVPVWGSNVRTGHVTIEQAEIYAAWLSDRYKEEPNIIWVNGGDVKGSDSTEIWRAIGSTIRKTSPGQLITYHPFGRTQSSEWFHNEEWLDFNMFQSGHRRYDQDTLGLHYGEDNWKYMVSDYNRTPVKPSLDGEPSYESIPQGLHDPSQPYWTNNEVRRYAYWSVFAGGCGFTYGHNAIMQFYKKGDPDRAYGVRETWDEALDAPGASEMKYLKELVLSRPYFERVPAQELLAGKNGEKYDYIAATRGKSFAFFYTWNGSTININTLRLQWDEFKASWFNPRNGSVNPIGTFTAGGTKTFDPQGGKQNGNDVVLILDRKR